MRNRYVLVADSWPSSCAWSAPSCCGSTGSSSASPEYTAAFNFALGAGLVVKPIVYYAFGLYRRYWRYAGLPDLLVILLAVSASAAAVALVIAGGDHGRRRAVLPALDPGPRLAADAGVRRRHPPVGPPARPSHSAHGRPAGRRPAADASACWSPAPATPARWSCARSAETRSSACGRSASSTTSRRSWASASTRCRCSARSPISRRVVDAPPHRRGRHRDADGARRGRARACSTPASGPASKSRAVPGVFELLEGGVSVSRLRQIDIADLLRRRPDRTPRRRPASTCRASVVLVTGAGGSIGSELCRQVARAQAAESDPARPRREQHLRRRQTSCASAFPAVRVPRRSSPTSATQRAARPCSHAHRARRSSSTPPRTSTCR